MKETKEEKFARESAEKIYTELCESDSFHQDAEMPNPFMAGIMVLDEKEIKEALTQAILHDVKNCPEAFESDNNELVYDSDMREDYEGVATQYIRNKFYQGRTKKLRLCKHCGSDNVEMRAWVKPNENNKFSDYVSDQEADDNYCLDCQNHGELLDAELTFVAEVEGFQVVGIDDTDQEGEIHPDMGGSFCLYSLSQAREMIAKKPNVWRLLTIWSGDVEDPTIMFVGNPRQ